MRNLKKAVGLCLCIGGGLTVFASTAGSQALTFQGIPYMDDRSTPQSLIESYYNAINRKVYVQAFTYLRFPKQSFEDFEKGYATTTSVELRYGATQPDPGAGQIYWALPVAIRSHTSDGKSQVFAGCYTIHLTNPGIPTDPPYEPMGIDSGELAPTDEPFEKAVPLSCER